jgi:hypothetical protein
MALHAGGRWFDPSIGYGFLFFDSEEKVVTLHSALPDDDNAW